ncbi:MAG: hypothetical protein ACPGEF_00455 [Endozoicomonas sp.]
MNWLVLLLLSLSLAADARSFLHRAVEPARMGLDISISGEKVTTYVVINEESLLFLSGMMETTNIYWALKNAELFAEPSVGAHCRVISHKVNQEVNRINGFQTLQCERPGKLKSMRVDLYKVIPKLKAVDVWVTSQRWQEKTTVYPDNPMVMIRSGVLR